MLRREGWEVGEELGLGHTAGKVFQHVVDGDPSTLEARFPAANTRVYLDIVIYFIHYCSG